eukprot:13073056-Ditylum_brightwellii.AAC.1
MVFLPLVLLLVLGVCLAVKQRFVQRLSLWDQVELLEGKSCLKSWSWDIHHHSLDVTVCVQHVNLLDHLVQGFPDQGNLMYCLDQALCLVNLDQVLRLA